MLVPFYHLGKAVSEPPYSRTSEKVVNRSL